MPQRTVFGDIVVDQHGEEAGFADEDVFAPLAVAVQPGGAALVWVEFVGGAFVEGFAHEAGDVGEAEPGLVFELEGAELAVVADEDLGFEAVGHRLVPLVEVGDGCGDLGGCDACNVKAPLD